MLGVAIVWQAVQEANLERLRRMVANPRTKLRDLAAEASRLGFELHVRLGDEEPEPRTVPLARYGGSPTPGG